MNAHPNASASAATTALAALALYVAHRLGWNGLSSEDALLGAGVLISLVLFVGRKGLKATLKAVWNGSPKKAQPEPAEPTT